LRNMSKHESIASQKEILVPIRVEFDIEGFKVTDLFTWNLNEPMITTEKFAEYICEDMQLEPTNFVPMISRYIKVQLEEYRKHYQINDLPPPQDSRITIRVYTFNF
jgi:hypothetical protein